MKKYPPSFTPFTVQSRRRFVFTCLLCFGAPLLWSATPATPPSAPLAPAPPVILFFGDSLAAGFGLDRPATESFPGLIQQKIDAAKLVGRVVNGGVSGNTSADGVSRIDWAMQAGAPDVFVLELGGNDGLRGLSVAAMQTNLQSIIDRVRAKNPAVKIVIAGLRLPAGLNVADNLRGAYADDFAAIFPALAKRNQATLIPYLLEGVGGIAALNQADGIHPTAAGDVKVAATVWTVLQPLLGPASSK